MNKSPFFLVHPIKISKKKKKKKKERRELFFPLLGTERSICDEVRERIYQAAKKFLLSEKKKKIIHFLYSRDLSVSACLLAGVVIYCGRAQRAFSFLNS